MADHLLWVDLETTSSDETKDCIIEVGAILTTTDLVVLGEFRSIVSPTAEGLGRLMLNPVVRSMHEGNGLLGEITSDTTGYKPHEVATRMLEWLALKDAKRGHVVLAGSGVGHFDRRFIARWMPQVDKFCRYWCIDVGVIRRAHEMWVGTEVSRANEGKTHRALDDIRCHLAEARAFQSLWNEASSTLTDHVVDPGATTMTSEERRAFREDGIVPVGWRWCPDCNGEGAVTSMSASYPHDETTYDCETCAAERGIVPDASS